MSALCYDIRLGTIIELYKTYATVYMGFSTVCFDYLCSQSGPLFLSLCELEWVSRGLQAILAFRVFVVPAHLFGLYYNHVFAFKYLGWMGFCVGRPCDISFI